MDVITLNNSNSNHIKNAFKYGIVLGGVGAITGGVTGLLSSSHWDSKNKQFSDKFIKQMAKNYSLSNSNAKDCYELFNINPKKNPVEKWSQISSKMMDNMTPEEAIRDVNNNAKVAEERIRRFQRKVLDSIKDEVKEFFDEKGCLIKTADKSSLTNDKDYNLIKKTLKQLKFKTSGKYALITMGVLFKIGLAIGLLVKKDKSK